MKCPNCQKQNKPNVKKCAYCNGLMPIRKKNTTTKKTTKKEETVVKEPIIELSEEKIAFKNFVKKIKSINKIVWVYLILILVAILLIILVNEKRSTSTCTLRNSDNDYSYSVNIILKHNQDKVSYFEYSSRYSSDDFSKNDYKNTYEAMIEGLSSKPGFSRIVSGSYGSKYWEMIYQFNESDFEYSEDYIDFDINKYANNYKEFINEMEKAGFDCN